MKYDALNQILCAALIDREFCSKLLKNPSLAVADGYLGNCFDLSTEEKNIMMGIKAKTIEDFAECIHQSIERQRYKQRISVGNNPQQLGFGVQMLRLEATSVL